MEAKLPGLQEWIRVRDYRAHEIGKLDNIATSISKAG